MHEELAQLFMAHIVKRYAGVQAGARLVHYSSADAAYKILQSKEVWLRDTRLMNDFSELQHGLTCLLKAWKSESGELFKAWMDGIYPGLTGRTEEIFNAHSPRLLDSTYMMSLSEHDDDEDVYGRLSMWRAYGGSAGVALVLNGTIFISETEELNVFSAPVVYCDLAGFQILFDDWVAGITANEDIIRRGGEEQVLAHLFQSLRIFVLCTKHPGFCEEREWRIFHTPSLDGESDWLDFDMTSIGGVPQAIQRLALRDDEARGIVGVAIPTLVNKIIIGPCDHPDPIRDTLAGMLVRAGLEGGSERVTISNVPLRRS